MSYSEDLDEVELKRLLGIVSDKGLRGLDITELNRLLLLLKAKDYGSNKKANKSKMNLLKQINATFYDKHRPR